MSSVPPPELQRWKCVCAYDGTNFAGWQSQAAATSSARGMPAIQDVIEARLGQIFKTSLRIHGSGRTDAGVHAHAQVFHFDAVWPHAPEKLLAAFRVGLPATIQIKSIQVAARNFHARFDATGKRYDYYVHVGDADPFTRPFCWTFFKPLDVAAMRAAAHVLTGKHDFRAFTALNGPEREDTVRELRRLDVTARGRRIHLRAEADGFLYKMVRSLAGTLVAAGEGKITAADVRRILHSRVRTPAVQTAPAQGLFLTKVYY